jgi:hypothetical protein
VTRVLVIRDWRDARDTCNLCRKPYRRCKATSPDGVRCVYGRGHRLERHSWVAER